MNALRSSHQRAAFRRFFITPSSFSKYTCSSLSSLAFNSTCNCWCLSNSLSLEKMVSRAYEAGFRKCYGDRPSNVSEMTPLMKKLNELMMTGRVMMKRYLSRGGKRGGTRKN